MNVILTDTLGVDALADIIMGYLDPERYLFASAHTNKLDDPKKAVEYNVIEMWRHLNGDYSARHYCFKAHFHSMYPLFVMNFDDYKAKYVQEFLEENRLSACYPCLYSAARHMAFNMDMLANSEYCHEIAANTSDTLDGIIQMRFVGPKRDRLEDIDRWYKLFHQFFDLTKIPKIIVPFRRTMKEMKHTCKSDTKNADSDSDSDSE